MEVSITPPSSSSPHYFTRLEIFHSKTTSTRSSAAGFEGAYRAAAADRELKCLRYDGPKSLVQVPDHHGLYRRARVKVREVQGERVRVKRGAGMSSEMGRRRGSEDGAVMALMNSGSLPPMEESPTGGGVLLEEEDEDDGALVSQQRQGKHHSRTKSQSKKSAQKSTFSSHTHTTSSGDMTTLLREKDLRIQNLESQILRLETEFHTQISKQSQSEAENTIYWQQKCSLEHRKFLEADTELRLLKEQKEAREMEREEVKKGYEVLRGRLAGRDEEVVGLRAQVRGLKDFVSVSTRTDGVQVTSDKALDEAMGKLVYGLQQWVVASFRRGKLRGWDGVSLDTRQEVGELCPVFEGVLKGDSGASRMVNKFHLLQGIVSGVLVERVFGRYFAGLRREDEERLRGVEGLMRGMGVGEESVNSWRAGTLATLRREGAAGGGGDAALGEFTEGVTNKTLKLLEGILDIPGPLPASTEPTLKQLVGSAVELSRVLAVQKAVLRVEFPKVRRQGEEKEEEESEAVVFDSESMEDIGGDEELDDDQEDGDGQGEKGEEKREVCCVVFPGLVKRGDEMGGSLGFRNVITKARVLCAGRGD